MRVEDPGHRFGLKMLDAKNSDNHWMLQYVKRMGAKYPGNKTEHPGTTIQEVCRAQISRLRYVNAQDPDANNDAAIAHEQWTIWHLEKRAFARHGKPFDLSPVDIETLPTNSYGHLWKEDSTQI